MRKFLEKIKSVFTKIKPERLKISMSSILRAGPKILILIVGLLIIIIATWTQLPSDKIKYYLLKQITPNLPENVTLDIGSLDNNWRGLILNDVQILTNNKIFPELLLEEVDIKLISWQLIILNLPLQAKTDGLTLKGKYNLWSKSFKIKDVWIPNQIPDIRKLNLFVGNPKVDIESIINKSTVVANLKMDTLVLNDKSAIFSLSPFSLPKDLTLNNINLDLDISTQKKNLEMVFDGDLNGKLAVSIQWNGAIDNSIYNMSVNSKLSDRLINENSGVISLFFTPYLKDQELNVEIYYNAQNRDFNIKRL